MDCMDFLYTVPDKAFALAIIDPPYGVGADKPHKKPSIARQRNGTYLRVKTNNYDPKEWDSTPPDERFFDELFRVSRNQIIFGANYFGLKGGMIVWDKLNYGGDQYGCEIAYQSFNQRTDIVHYMWRGMIQGAYCGDDVGRALIQQGNKKLNEKRIHPTQKPVALYAWLLQHYASKGDNILDTHLGSGSSRIAAFKLGFDFTGIEIDPDYFALQEARFRRECFGEEIIPDGRALKQLTLF